MKYTKIPLETFESLQLNAGVLLYDFDPENIPDDETIYKNMMCATSGGIEIDANPTYTDLGEDIDNCPKNTMELKQLESWECKASGTMVSVTPESAKFALAAADIEYLSEADENGLRNAHIKMRNDLDVDTDFKSLWWVGDYGNKDGCVACHILNALSTGGLKIKTNDKEKSNMDFEFTGHYSINAQDDVPFDFYIIPNPEAGTTPTSAKPAENDGEDDETVNDTEIADEAVTDEAV